MTMIPIPRRVLLLLLLAVLLVPLLSACGGGLQSNDPVFIVASPQPLDAGFVNYRHSSGVFTLRIPPDWIAGELPDPGGVRVQFTTVEGNEAITRLSIYIVNTGAPMTPEGFAGAVAAYQPPDDLAAYGWDEVDRTVMRDTSHRITGIRLYPMLGPRQLNIFLQGNGAFFSALEVDVTDADQATLETLTAVVNTFTINTDAEVTVGTVQQAAAGATSYTGVIGFNGYHTWTDGDGVFHITGEAVNTTPYPIEAVRISGVLYDAQGRRLAEQPDILTVDILNSGQGAPFDLRFEGGKPVTTVRFELNVAARDAEYALDTYYGPENFRTANVEATYNAQNVLVVRGDLANIGPDIAESVKVVVALWDDQGRVVGAETLYVNKPQLVPQEAITFEVPFYQVGGPAITYTLTVLGQRGEPEAGN